MSLPDERVRFEGAVAHPAFQAMQEINEWFERSRQSDPKNALPEEQEAGNNTAEILETFVDLSLNVAELLINGSEFSATAGIQAVLDLAPLPVILLTRGMLAIRNTEADRRNAEYAFSLMNAEGLTYFLVHIATYGRAPSDTEMSRASHIFKAMEAIDDIGEDFKKLASGLTVDKQMLAAARMGNAAWSLHPKSAGNSSAMPSASVSHASSSDSTANSSPGEAAKGPTHSAQRQTFGAPSSYAWGDPQQSQFKLANGTSLRGMNRFGDLLPRYAGGTSEANQPRFQFLQNGDEQDDTIISNPEDTQPQLSPEPQQLNNVLPD